MAPRVRTTDLKKMKERGEKIVMLTAYDYPFAKILDEAGVDVLLIGDSVGMVFSGYENTLPVTVEEMIYHTRAVVRGRKRALIVTDMPFMSYQGSIEEARRNAGRILKEGGSDAVKLEGGAPMAETIQSLVSIGIPVMGHVGLTPQSIHQMGGYKVQGKNRSQRERLLGDAKAVEEAGAFALVLEGIPADLATQVTKSISIPTIGIGAGVHCEGQVLVIHDLAGLLGDFQPTFVKRYCDGRALISKAVQEYVQEVRGGKFPTERHSYS
ncbi:MAG: 3-methyl-2-oxobutanoate hydroxymethyltransferase [Deltaproteobacteria bacterium]|nr:3-methyl-2-oxobutanoate hydroxymethyltransferase [Deltaproteobacteria bacterium]